MIKFCFCVIPILFLVNSCSDFGNKNHKNVQDEEVRPAGDEKINSYNADTFYSSLKKQIVNLSSSRDIEEVLCQGWVNPDDLYDLTKRKMKVGIENQTIRSYHFFTDHTFMRNVRNRMESGRWILNLEKKELSLVYNDGGGGDHFKIMAIASDELKITDLDIERHDIYTFAGEAKSYLNKTDDPFYTANNLWRKHPSQMESDEQVQMRVKNYLHFFILIYKDAIAKESEFISFYDFPTCINWYAGGIYLKSENEEYDNWKNCFYDKTQADKAYQLMGKIIDKKYEWPGGNMNWIKKNLFVLEQMYQQL
jgi:hypothetical protein